MSLRLAKVGKIVYNSKQVVYTSPRRFENQPPLRTLWPYITTFVHMVALSQVGGKRRGLNGNQRRPLLKRCLYAGLPLLVAGILLGLAFDPTSQFYGKVYCSSLDHQAKKIALTFDDGPNEPYTSEVLKILDKYHIKATFFLIGENAESYPASVRKIISHGNILGNHSFRHSYRLPFQSKAAVENNVKETEDIIYSISGLRTRLFRPPHGLRTPWYLKEIGKMGYSCITWNDMTDDYDLADSPQEISDAIIKGAKPGGIIVLHDGKNLNHGVNRSNTVAALPIIIGALQKQGYTFVTLPDLLRIKPYEPSIVSESHSATAWIGRDEISTIDR